MLTKVHLVKAIVFPVVMYGCESWTIKKAEHGRIDAFELWCWRRLLRVPWTTRLSNKSVLNFHWKDWCWSWISNTLATWCEELTHWKSPWCWEILKARGEGNNRGWDGWMASRTRWTWVWASSGSWWWTEKPGVLQSMWSQRVRHDWATELNWKEGKNAVDGGELFSTSVSLKGDTYNFPHTRCITIKLQNPRDQESSLESNNREKRGYLKMYSN